jgi:hypothetical protein
MSHDQHINEHSQAFSEVHPDASNQQQYEKASSHANMVAHALRSEKKQVASHNKYGF